MTTAEIMPIQQHVRIVVHHDTWQTFTTWLEATGQKLVQRPGTRTRPPAWTVAPAPDLTEPANLSRREFQVLVAIAKGKSNPQIARELYLATNTIKTHVARIMRKLHVDDRAAAVDAAHRRGLLGGGS